MDIIFINGLRFDAIIGIYDRERVEPQPLVIDLEMAIDIREAAATGNLDASLNYAAISERIIQFCQQAQALLIETLAEDLSHTLMSEFNIQGMRLSIHKPNAVPEARSVGLKIARGVSF